MEVQVTIFTCCNDSFSAFFISTLLDCSLSESLDQVGDLDLDLMELPSLEGLGEEEDLFFDCSLSETESFNHEGDFASLKPLGERTTLCLSSKSFNSRCHDDTLPSLHDRSLSDRNPFGNWSLRNPPPPQKLSDRWIKLRSLSLYRSNPFLRSKPSKSCSDRFRTSREPSRSSSTVRSLSYRDDDDEDDETKPLRAFSCL